MPKSELLPTVNQADAPPRADAKSGVFPSLYSIPDARRRAGGIGNTLAYQLIAQGKWKAVKLCGRTFITAASLDAFIASLPRADIHTGRRAAV